MKRNIKKQITAIMLCMVHITSALPAMAEETENGKIIDSGFINPLDEPLPAIGADGFINPLDEPLPTAGDNGFIDEIDVDLPTKRSDGFIVAPEKPLPTRGDDGFIIPLEEEIPKRCDGEFINPVSKSLPDTDASGFLKDIPEADGRAKIITTAEELANIRSGRYALGCDIDLSSYNGGVWYPITPNGSVQLDGQGHTIYNLNIPKESKEIYAGLFGSCYYSVKITNLALVNNISGKGITVGKNNNEKIYAAGFVAKGSVTLDNCYSNVPITIDNTESLWGGCYAGGLIGYSSAVVKNSYYEGVIDIAQKGETNKVFSGGIMAAGTINAESSFNRGSIYAGNTNGYETGTNEPDGGTAGGILASGGGYVTGCANTGFVSAQVAGGLVGCAGDKLTVKNSCNMGEISLFTEKNYSVTDEFSAGGLIAKAQNATIENSFNSGRITKESISEEQNTRGEAGGLIGNAVKARIVHSYNSGDIISDVPEALPGFVEYVGGLVGYGDEITASGCYNSGTLGSTMNVGGIMGYGSLLIDYSCNYGEIFGMCVVGGIIGGGEVDAESCINKGKITFSFYDGEKPYSSLRNYGIGGIIGGHIMDYSKDYSEYNSIINNCVNEGEIYSRYVYNYAYEYHNVGGISGNASVQVTSCCNVGDITIEEVEGYDIGVAGITAFSSPETRIINCINEGNIITAGGLAAGITTAGMTNDSDDKKIFSIERCYNTGDFVNSGSWGYISAQVCGIGNATDTIRDCYNEGEGPGRGNGIGSADEIYNCYNKGNGFGTGIGEGSISVKYCYNSAETGYGIGSGRNISFCYNTGECSKGIGEGENITNCFNAGDLCGVAIKGIGDAKENIINCFNIGKVVRIEEADNQRNIFCGIGSAKNIKNCYNIADVTDVEVVSFMGIGDADEEISNCFNRGGAYTENDAAISGTAYGIGKAKKIKRCYNTGKLYAETAVGIGIGYNKENIVVEDCYNSGNLKVVRKHYGMDDVAGITVQSDNVINCYNTGDITVTQPDGICGISGIAVDSKSVVSCYNLGDIYFPYEDGAVGVGGIIAWNMISYDGDGFNEEDAKVVNCFNMGNIYSGYWFVGGISSGSITVINCYNTGNIRSEYVCGGISGYEGNIINCYNSGSITSNRVAGGIVGWGECSVSNSYNIGSVNVSSDVQDVYAGGIIGSGGGTITDSHNSGSVKAVTTAVPTENGSISYKACVGGLVGILSDQNHYLKCSVTNSRNHGDLTTYSTYYIYLGGIVSRGPTYSQYDGVSEYYELPYMRIDNNTYSTGIRDFNCKAPVTDENGHTYYYSHNGEYVGDGEIGITGGRFPEAIELKGRSIICTDETVEFEAVLTPSEGVDTSLVWTSTDPSVAEVDAEGNVTGIGEGKAIITATTKNGLTASREIEVVEDGMIIEVMGFVEDKPEEPYLLPGATVDVGGVVKMTDENGIAVFKKKELPDKASENVVVSCGEDYVPSERLLPLLTYSNGMKKFHFALKYRSENIYITKAQLKLDGKFDDLIGVSTVVGIPLFGQDGSVNEKGYSFNVEMDWNRCTDNVEARKIYLYGTESGKLVSLQEGVNSVAFAKNFEVGEPIKIIAKTLDNEGNEVRAEKIIGLNVRIVDFKLDMPESPEIEIEGPNWLKYVEDNLGLRLSLDDIDDYGGNIYYKNGILKIRLEMKDNTTDDHKNRIKKMNLIRNANPIDVGIYGELSIPVHEDAQGEWSGNIGATTIGVNADYEDEEEIVKLLEAVHNFYVGPVPLFVSFTFSGGATASMGIGGKVYDAYFDGNMTGKARGAIRGGVGRKYSDNFEVSFGPTGTLTLILPFDFKAYGLIDSSEFTFNPSLEGNLLAELIVDTKWVDFNGELEVGSFEWDKDGLRWTTIAGDSGVVVMSEEEFSGLKLKNIGREYLENGGGFKGNGGLMLMSNDSLERVENILYENIIKSADAAVCEIDGRTCLIYTYDNLLRDEDNGLTAMYTIKTDSGWSEPQMLWDDGTIDSAPVADGKFVAWRDKKSELSEDVTLEELFKADEISAAFFNGSDFETVRLTGNDIYDFGVKVASNGDRAIVAWLSNDAADFTSTTGNTSLNYALYDGGWSDVSTISDIGAVSNINVSYIGNTPKIVYKNADNEFYSVTAGNTPVRLLDSIGRYAFSEVSGKDITAYFDEENILHINIGTEEVKTVATEFIGNENPIIATNSQSASVFWLEEDGIYYVTNASGEWSEKLQLVKSDERIQKLDATFTDENNYFVSYFESDGTVTNLKSVNASVGKDLTIRGIEYDEEVYKQNSELKYSLKLFNNGEIASGGGTVYVYENQDVISSFDFDGSVMPGETLDVDGTVTCVDLSEKHNYTFEIVSDGDYNTSNNTRNLSVGSCDVRLQDAYFTVDELGRENLVIEVLNDGNVIIDGTTVKVYKDSVESEALYDVKIGSIKPGEYAPIILDEIQDTEAIYYITAECESDEKEYNNMVLVGYESIEEVNNDDKPLVFDKATGVLKFSADKALVAGDAGECIIAVYDQNGTLKSVYLEEIDFGADVITKEKIIENVSDGDIVKLMLWKDAEKMIPVSEPFTTTVMP